MCEHDRNNCEEEGIIKVVLSVEVLQEYKGGSDK